MVFDNKETFEIISSAKLDFLTLVEAGVRPPIAFKSREQLLDWAKQLNDFTLHRIGRRSPKNAMVVKGVIKVPKRFYRQVWVRAAYKSYRGAMIEYFTLITGGHHIDRYDIDHSVSRKTLKRDWPEAWVNVLYVETGINRSIGSMMERTTAMDLRHADTFVFNAECLLKVFYKRNGKLSRSMIPTYMQEAASRFITRPEQGATKGEARNVKRILEEIHTEARIPLTATSGPTVDDPEGRDA